MTAASVWADCPTCACCKVAKLSGHTHCSRCLEDIERGGAAGGHQPRAKKKEAAVTKFWSVNKVTGKVISVDERYEAELPWVKVVAESGLDAIRVANLPASPGVYPRLTLPEELEETIESALATWQDVSLHQGPPTNHDQINREAALTEYLVKAREQARELRGLLKAAANSLRRVL